MIGFGLPGWYSNGLNRIWLTDAKRMRLGDCLFSKADLKLTRESLNGQFELKVNPDKTDFLFTGKKTTVE